MNDAEFLEMCRLAASRDTGGRWTDEKIDAIEEVNVDPRGAVRRLYGMLAAERARAEAAERELSDERGHKDVIYAAFKAAEAKLAAVPVDAIRRCFAQEYNNEEQWASDTNIVQAWLAQPDEVQP